MSAIEVVGTYGAALRSGDMAALADTLADTIVWHQPGSHQLAGDHSGPEAVMAHLGRFMELSGGTFALVPDVVTESGNLVSMTVHFSAQRAGAKDLDQRGVDIFRVENGRIAEVWLISEDQTAEDQFWG